MHGESKRVENRDREATKETKNIVRDSRVSEALSIFHDKKASAEQLEKACRLLASPDLSFLREDSLLQRRDCTDVHKRNLQDKIRQKFDTAQIIYSGEYSPLVPISDDQVISRNIKFSSKIRSLGSYNIEKDRITLNSSLAIEQQNFPTLHQLRLTATIIHEEEHRKNFSRRALGRLCIIESNDKQKEPHVSQRDLVVPEKFYKASRQVLSWIDEIGAYLSEVDMSDYGDFAEYLKMLKEHKRYTDTDAPKAGTLEVLVITIAAGKEIGVQPVDILEQLVTRYQIYERLHLSPQLTSALLLRQAESIVRSEAKKIGRTEELSELGKRYILRGQVKYLLANALTAEALQEVGEMLESKQSYELIAPEGNLAAKVYFIPDMFKSRSNIPSRYQPAFVLKKMTDDKGESSQFGNYRLSLRYFDPTTGGSYVVPSRNIESLRSDEFQNAFKDFVKTLPNELVSDLLRSANSSSVLQTHLHSLSETLSDQFIMELNIQHGLAFERAKEILATRQQNRKRTNFSQAMKLLQEELLEKEYVAAQRPTYLPVKISRMSENEMGSVTTIALRNHSIQGVPYDAAAVVTIPNKEYLDAGKLSITLASVEKVPNEERLRQVAKAIIDSLPHVTRQAMSLNYRAGNFELPRDVQDTHGRLVSEVRKYLEELGYAVIAGAKQKRIITIADWFSKYVK